MRFGLLLIIGMIALLWAGGQELWTSITNWSPTELTYVEFLKDKPKSSWLKLKSCVLDLSEASYKASKSGKIEEVYIPVHGIGETSGEKVHVLLASTDTSFISTVNAMKNIKTESEAVTYMEKNKAVIFPQRDLEGTVRFGFDLDSKDRTEIAKLNGDLSSDFAIVDEGKQPSLMKGLLMFGGGLLLGGIGVGSLRKK